MERTSVEMAVGEIAASRWQVRRAFDPQTNAADAELVESVKHYGILNALLVWKPSDSSGCELVAGHRRLAAARAAGLKTVPVQAVQYDDPREVQALVLVENLQRADLTAIEEAQAYRDLMQAQGLTQAELAKRIGKSQGHVSQMLSLLGMAPEVQAMVAEGALDTTVARELAGMAQEMQPAMATFVVEELTGKRMTARKAANLVRKLEEASHVEFWQVPEGAVVSPTQRNGALVCTHWIEQARAAGALTGALLQISRNGVLKSGSALEFYDVERVATFCGSRDRGGTTWRDLAEARGFTCDACQLKQAGLTGEDTLVGKWECKAGKVPCRWFEGPADPFLIPMHGDVTWHHTCDACQKLQTIGRVSYCPDASCYTATLAKVRKEQGQKAQEAHLDRRDVEKLRVRTWQDMQQNMNTASWLAQPCNECMMQDRRSLECERVAHLEDWRRGPEFYTVSAEGVVASERHSGVVPRCRGFKLGRVDLIPECAANAASVEWWLQHMLSGRSTHASWMPLHDTDSPEKLLDKVLQWAGSLSLERRMGLLTMIANESNVLAAWNRIWDSTRKAHVTVLNPHTRELETWALARVQIDQEKGADLAGADCVDEQAGDALVVLEADSV